jgi:hypothetical protein
MGTELAEAHEVPGLCVHGACLPRISPQYVTGGGYLFTLPPFEHHQQQHMAAQLKPWCCIMIKHAELPSEKCCCHAGGAMITFDKLIIATGARVGV